MSAGHVGTPSRLRPRKRPRKLALLCLAVSAGCVLGFLLAGLLACLLLCQQVPTLTSSVSDTQLELNPAGKLLLSTRYSEVLSRSTRYSSIVAITWCRQCKSYGLPTVAMSLQMCTEKSIFSDLFATVHIFRPVRQLFARQNLLQNKTCYKLVDCLWKGYKPTKRVSPFRFF